MTALQKIVLGTPPAAVDGDPVRTASTKMNANVDVLNTQATITSFATTLTVAQALTAANHLGKRVNINLASAGTINLPAASTCVADGQILLRNLGTTVVSLAVTAGSGDGLNAVGTLYPGDTMLLDTDGVHTWYSTIRGRSSTAKEVVPGDMQVGGTFTVGTLAVTNPASARANLGVGKTLISTTVIAANAAFCVVALPGGYYDYEIEFDGINVTTDAANLWLRLAADTSNWIVGTNNSYMYQYQAIATATVLSAVGTSNTSQIQLFSGLSSTAPYSTHGTVKIRNATDGTRFKHVQWSMVSMTSSGTYYRVDGSGLVLSGAILGGVLLIPSTGNFASGTVSLFGVNR
ncbi:hypothetical protein [Caballeronia sp. DA-9]|uniref:hypothetical protein n=1 Tax=Caballeronia sp. DA-9 TaxID=3436237 RepID=UPI003F67C68F